MFVALARSRRMLIVIRWLSFGLLSPSFSASACEWECVLVISFLSVCLCTNTRSYILSFSSYSLLTYSHTKRVLVSLIISLSFTSLQTLPHTFLPSRSYHTRIHTVFVHFITVAVDFFRFIFKCVLLLVIVVDYHYYYYYSNKSVEKCMHTIHKSL